VREHFDIGRLARKGEVRQGRRRAPGGRFGRQVVVLWTRRRRRLRLVRGWVDFGEVGELFQEVDNLKIEEVPALRSSVVE